MKYPATYIDLSKSLLLISVLLHVFWHSIIKCENIAMSYWLIDPFIIMKCLHFSLVIVLLSKSILSENYPAAVSSSCLMFTYYTCFQCLCSQNLSYISCRQHTVLYYFFIILYYLYPLIGVFSLFTYNVIIHMIVFNSTIFLFII